MTRGQAQASLPRSRWHACSTSQAADPLCFLRASAATAFPVLTVDYELLTVGSLLTPLQCTLARMYEYKSFRMCTYRKQGGGGGGIKTSNCLCKKNLLKFSASISFSSPFHLLDSRPVTCTHAFCALILWQCCSPRGPGQKKRSLFSFPRTIYPEFACRRQAKPRDGSASFLGRKHLQCLGTVETQRGKSSESRVAPAVRPLRFPPLTLLSSCDDRRSQRKLFGSENRKR